MQSGQAFEDVNGNKYQGFPRPIGQGNCRHIKFPIVIGISEPTYTEEQLKEFAENSKQKYDLTQKQRAMETKLRQLKLPELLHFLKITKKNRKSTKYVHKFVVK